jgi:TRAP-type C4-dicarboxylate transport system substrate-binding protein
MRSGIMKRPNWRAIAVAACILCAPGASVGETKLRMASFIPPSSLSATHVLGPYAAAVERDAEGDLKIQAFWGGTLGRDPFKQYSLLTDGVIDIGLVQAVFSTGQFPDDMLFELPYVVRTAEEASVAKWRMFERRLLRGYDDIKVIGHYTTSPLAMHTRKPFVAISDVAGMRIFASSNPVMNYVRLIGAAPIALSITEVAEAIGRGTVDGLITNWEALYRFRIHHVVEYHLDAPLGTISFIVAMNKKAWEGLSAKAKAAVDKHGGEGFSRAAGKVYDDGDRDALAKLKADTKRRFITENSADAERSRAMMKPTYDEWISSTPDGQKKFDSLQAILSEVRTGR